MVSFLSRQRARLSALCERRRTISVATELGFSHLCLATAGMQPLLDSRVEFDDANRQDLAFFKGYSTIPWAWRLSGFGKIRRNTASFDNSVDRDPPNWDAQAEIVEF